MDKYDPQKKIGLVVDEWGNWYDVEPGSESRLPLSAKHAARCADGGGESWICFKRMPIAFRWPNIAQMINVLQAMILTDKEKMVLTPTYHVFEMYNVHQGATLIPLEVKSPDYELNGKSVPSVHATASRDARRQDPHLASEPGSQSWRSDFGHRSQRHRDRQRTHSDRPRTQCA